MYSAFATLACRIFHGPEWDFLGGTTRRYLYHCWACRTFRGWPRKVKR